MQSCSDFYPAPGFPESANKFVFGINTRGCGLGSGGMILGTFDSASGRFTPDNKEVRWCYVAVVVFVIVVFVVICCCC